MLKFSDKGGITNMSNISGKPNHLENSIDASQNTGAVENAAEISSKGPEIINFQESTQATERRRALELFNTTEYSGTPGEVQSIFNQLILLASNELNEESLPSHIDALDKFSNALYILTSDLQRMNLVIKSEERNTLIASLSEHAFDSRVMKGRGTSQEQIINNTISIIDIEAIQKAIIAQKENIAMITYLVTKGYEAHYEDKFGQLAKPEVLKAA
jgi:hypothetical protein